MNTLTNLKNDVLKLLSDQNRFITKRELCQLLGIKGARRRELKQALLELKAEGLYAHDKKEAPNMPMYKNTTASYQENTKTKQKSFRNSPHTDKQLPSKKQENKDLATKLSKDKGFRGHRVSPNHCVMGLFCTKGERSWIEAIHRKKPFHPILLAGTDLEDIFPLNLQHNDVIEFQITLKGKITILRKIGNLSEPKVFSLIAIEQADIPFAFNEKAIDQAQTAAVPPLGKRTDYRNIPLVTIDGEDARDFDDAVFARPDANPDNPGGWFAIVAIADVSYYVRAFDALDNEAYERGNSVYFADRVVPMLPEALSNEMCSLKPHEDRACLAVEMHISKQGDLRSFEFKRGLMRSFARLTYGEVQNLIEASQKDVSQNAAITETNKLDLWQDILKPLYGVYKSLRFARDKRGSLHLESTERKVIFNEEGKIKAIVPRIQQESNQLIEELMIAANVCAAKALNEKKWPALYRVHDKPDETRVTNMKRVVSSLGLAVPKEKKLEPKAFNIFLTVNSPFKRMIHDLVLRAQAQAVYSPQNIGHFGLGLQLYTHFTSPIRRYADLCVHRALIQAFHLGDGGVDPLPMNELEQIGQHISATERQAAQLEREVMDRYLVLHLEDYIGFTFEAIIVGVTGSGLFFELEKNGAQGFLRKSELGDDFFVFDEEHHRYVGTRTKRTFQLGDPIRVLLEAADARSATTVFSLQNPTSSLKEKRFTRGEEYKNSSAKNNKKGRKSNKKEKTDREPYSDSQNKGHKKRTRSDWQEDVGSVHTETKRKGNKQKNTTHSPFPSSRYTRLQSKESHLETSSYHLITKITPKEKNDASVSSQNNKGTKTTSKKDSKTPHLNKKVTPSTEFIDQKDSVPFSKNKKNTKAGKAFVQDKPKKGSKNSSNTLSSPLMGVDKRKPAKQTTNTAKKKQSISDYETVHTLAPVPRKSRTIQKNFRTETTPLKELEPKKGQS